jgi:TRAP-type C4-dicarboxylate transport system substrate-binding protein
MKTASPKTMMKFAVCAIAMAAGFSVTPTSQAQTTLRLSTYVNETDIRYQGFQKFAELAEAKTQGRVKVQIFPSATLHGWSEGVDAVLGGVSDISWIPADKRLACYRVTSLYPALVNLDDQIELDSKFAQLIKPEAEKVGLVPLINSNYSYDQEWWFKGRVDDISKLDGKLVRSIGPLVSMMIESWGGKPVFIAPKEVYQSAERGVVDGINMGVATYSSWKLWDVMPYMVNGTLFYGNIIYMINKKKLDALSPEDQKALMAAGNESEVWLKPRYEEWVNEQVGNAVMKGGGSAVSLPLAQRQALVNQAQQTWNTTVDQDCGPELSKQVRSLFDSYTN